MGPFKCPDCGTWWAGMEHRCGPSTVRTTFPVVSPDVFVPPSDTVTIGNYPYVCTCPPNRGDNYMGSCPIHDVHTTYTV